MMTRVIALVMLLVGVTTGAQAQTVVGDRFRYTTGCVWRSGTGSPESAVTGSPCDWYVQVDSPYALWRKTSGTGNTGWVAVTTGTSGMPTPGGAGTIVRSDGSNWATSTTVWPNAGTQYRVPYWTATNTLGESSNLTFDGATLSSPYFSGQKITISGSLAGQNAALIYNTSATGYGPYVSAGTGASRYAFYVADKDGNPIWEAYQGYTQTTGYAATKDSSAPGNYLYINSNQYAVWRATAAETWIGTIQNIPWYVLTNNTERLRITATGLVGIGTASPVAKLDVVGRVRSLGERLEASDSTTPSTGETIQVYHDGSVGVVKTTYFTGAYTPLTFQTSDVERARIATDGQATFTSPLPFGITVNNTTSAGSNTGAGIRFQANGTTHGFIGGYSSWTGAGTDKSMMIASETGMGFTVFVNGSAVPRIAVSSGGVTTVRHGTSGTGGFIVTDGSRAMYSYTDSSGVGWSNANPWSGGAMLYFYGQEAYLYTGSTAQVQVTSTGLGINAAPTRRLDVNGTSRFRDAIYLGASDDQGLWSWTSDMGNGEPGVVFRGLASKGLLLGANNGLDAIRIAVNGQSTLLSQAHVASHVTPVTNYTSNLGSLSKKYLTLHAAELWVETLVAQDVMATIGGRVNVAPTTMLTADMPSGDTSFYVKHNNLASGDRVRMESDGKVEWIAITSGATYINATLGYQYSITRNLDGSGANQWYAGDAVLNTGTTGDGFIDLYSVSGVLSGYGPTIVGNVRTGTTYSDIAPRWAIGNLNGVGYGSYSSDIYGAAFGNPSAAHIIIDATNGIRIRHNATDKITLSPSGDASFTGSITSTSGYIASFNIAGTKLWSGSGASYVAIDSNETIAVWLGNETASSAPFRVTRAGAVTAESGTIGGWSLTSQQLSSGSGSTFVGLNSTAGTIRIWAGSSTAASAPFRVSETGALTAEEGNIAGWALTPTYFQAAGGYLRIYSGASNAAHIQAGDGSSSTAGVNSAVSGTDISFWAGQTHSNRTNAPFRVTLAGALTATNAVITSASGTITLDSNGITSTIGTSGISGTSAYRFTPSTEAGSTFGMYGFEPGGGLTQRWVSVANIGTGNTTTVSQLTADNSVAGAAYAFAFTCESAPNSSDVLPGTSTQCVGSTSYAGFTADRIVLTGTTYTSNVETTGTVTATSTVRSNSGFNINGTAGHSATCSGTAGTLTFSGGILTSCTSADSAVDRLSELEAEVRELRRLLLALVSGKQQGATQ